MNAREKRFAISVQYGSGYHYFRSYHDEDPTKLAEFEQELLNKAHKARGNRGAKPHVMVWERKEASK
jgi:hypothetical protein